MASVTQLLESLRAGDTAASAALYAHLYPEIKRVARARLAQAGTPVGLNATALVNEGFLRIADLEGLQGRTRGEFLVYVGHVLRSVVIDHLRASSADKRGAGGLMLTLSSAENEPAILTGAVELIAVHRALQAMQAMQAIDTRLYELMEMLHFAGAGIVEIAALRCVSRRTVERDVIKARLLLGELLGTGRDARRADRAGQAPA